MPMSWEDFRTFLMTSQPFRLRQMFYQLNQKGANLPMLGSQREQVNRLMERFLRISTDEQRQVFPEYFRDRDSARNLLQRQNGVSRNGQNSANDNSSNTTADRRTSRLRPYHVNRPLNGIINEQSNPARHYHHAHQPPARFERRQDQDYEPPARFERRRDQDYQPPVRIERRHEQDYQPPARIERLYVPRGQYTFNSQNVTERQPQTPNLDMRPALSATFDFPSPLRMRLAPTAHAPADRATYQLTPRPQRRLSFSGSPAPPSGESRRRSMSVSMEGNGPCVTAAKTEDSRGKMANLECKVECAFKPCGHACACYDCARHLGFRLGRCPICRGVIAEIIRIYW